MSRAISINYQPTRFEQALCYLSPIAAANRMNARISFELMRAHYAAADINRGTGDWRRVGGRNPHARLSSDMNLIAERARYLYESTSHGRSAITSIVDAAVGDGITTKSKAIFTRGDSEEAAKEQAFKRSIANDTRRRWEQHADFERRQEWPEMQQMILRETMVSGEILMREVIDPDWLKTGNPIPLQYQLIRRERLVSFRTTPISGNHVVDGLEIDEFGRVVAYHIESDDLGTFGGRLLHKAERIPFNEMIHVYRQDFPGARRGLSWMAPVIPDMQQFALVREYAVIARKVQSAIALIVSNSKQGRGKRPGLSGQDPKKDKRGTKLTAVEPGMIHHVGDGEVHSHLPTPSNDLEILTLLMLRSIGVGFGISYEWISGDYSKVNFAGGRLGVLQNRKRIRPIHGFFTRKVERTVNRRVVDAARAFVPNYPRAVTGEDIYRSDWSQPRFDYGVNPLQEVKASLLAISGGLSNLEIEAGSLGRDHEETLAGISDTVLFGQLLMPELKLHTELTDPDTTEAEL